MSLYARTFVAVLVLAAFNLPAATAQTQLTACSRGKFQYTCDKAQFMRVLKGEQTIAAESQPSNRISEKALKGLARDLGKTVQPGSADLIFVLGLPDPDGIYIGPNDRELANLRIYARASNGGHGPLLWVEVYRGQPDIIWPMVVQATIHQFKAEFK